MAFVSKKKEAFENLDEKIELYLEALQRVSTNEARAVSRVDTGLSKASKFSTKLDKERIETRAPVEYDVYLEYRYAIMFKAMFNTTRKMIKLAKRFF